MVWKFIWYIYSISWNVLRVVQRCPCFHMHCTKHTLSDPPPPFKKYASTVLKIIKIILKCNKNCCVYSPKTWGIWLSFCLVYDYEVFKSLYARWYNGMMIDALLPNMHCIVMGFVSFKICYIPRKCSRRECWRFFQNCYENTKPSTIQYAKCFV